jgi:hypothetical protein
MGTGNLGDGVMLKKFALLAVALTLAAPAFADEPSNPNSPASKNVAGGTKPPSNHKGHRSKWSDGTEVHAFGQKVQSPYDSNGKSSGKRPHEPVPPANGSVEKRIPMGFDPAPNAPPK